MKKLSRTNRSFTLILGPALIGGLLASAPAHGAGVNAGTLIENTASASFDDGGVPRNISSNTVTVRVDELLDVTTTSLDPGPIRTRPGNAVLTFELTNQGNGPEAFRLVANPAVAGNNFDTTIRGIAIDTNGNNIYDENVDQILAQPQTTPVLDPNGRATLFVLVTVPQSATDGQTTNVQLSAEAVTGSGTPGTVFAAAGAGGGDAIVGMTGALATARGALISGVASVELVKSVVLRDPFGGTSAVRGSVATFTIEARVTGSGDVANLTITDPIPAGTTYAAETLRLDGAALSDAADSDAGTASNGSGIAVNLGTVTAGTQRSVTFNVTIN
jgi:uncharacterized repeat protein (TIGR01451 family)